MTERKPRDVKFETWIERQIRRAAERGDFENLPGAGKPLGDLGRPHDEMWWVKRKLQSENLSYLPPSLALRKEVHDTLEAAAGAAGESEVRAIVGGLNETIAEANRQPLRGPSVMLRQIDVEQFVDEWRRRRG
jgi:hypothetical protein